MHLEKPSIHQRAQGRWDGILSSMGVDAAMLNTRKHHPCPWCGGKDRFRFTDKDGSGSFICGQCGRHSPIDFLMKMKGWDFPTAAQEVERIMGDVRPTVRKDNSEWALRERRAIWKESEPIEHGDIVDRYLAGRAIVMKRFPESLRKVDRMEHRSEDGSRTWHPGFIARIRAPDGQDVNIHRTYLLPDASGKAAVDSPRKVMSGEIKAGSAVRLYDQHGSVLGIAEGIETALSASAIFRVPVWAALNSTLLEKWEPPAEVQEVVVFGDNDPKFGGQAAATALAHRLATRRKITVRLEIPASVGTDWNDVLLTQHGKAA